MIPSQVQHHTREEKELVNFLIEVSKIGYGKTKREVLAIVKSTVLKKKGKICQWEGLVASFYATKSCAVIAYC